MTSYNLYEIPVIKLDKQLDQPSSIIRYLTTHILECSFDLIKNDYDKYMIVIGKLIRLNLITINYESNLAVANSELKYESIENSNYILDIKVKHSEEHNETMITRGILEIIDFSQSFIKICID